MRELRYSILADIQDAIEQEKLGKLTLFWQRTIQREYYGKKVTPGEQQAYEQLQSILSEVPQWGVSRMGYGYCNIIYGQIRQKSLIFFVYL